MAVIERIPHLDVTPEQIAEFCKKWDIRELAVFGSVLRDDFSDESDVDMLFVPGPTLKVTLSSLFKMQSELEALLKRPVDLHLKREAENDRNPLRRRRILGSAQIIYVP